MKYFGWVLSIVLLGAALFIYNGWNTANAQAQAQADNFTASYNAIVEQNAQREAQWQATLNSTVTTLNAQWQSTVDATVISEVAKAVAARDAQWQTTSNSTMTKALADLKANLDVQWLATVNTTVSNALANRDAQWRAALTAAGVNATINIK